MQEKTMTKIVNQSANEHGVFFNEVSFTIIALFMAAALTTYRYPADQPELFFRGKTTLSCNFYAIYRIMLQYFTAIFNHC